MSKILVNHANLRLAAGNLQGLSVDLEGDSQRLIVASQNLLDNWQGEGSSIFSAAATSVASFLQNTSQLAAAESLSTSKANDTFVNQDTVVAAILATTGE